MIELCIFMEGDTLENIVIKLNTEKQKLTTGTWLTANKRVEIILHGILQSQTEAKRSQDLFKCIFGITLLKGMGIILKARRFLNKSTLINLYNSFIFPYMTYCVDIWGNACESNLDPLIKLRFFLCRLWNYGTYMTTIYQTKKNS